jgi:excisionase family DNA binding protein
MRQLHTVSQVAELLAVPAGRITTAIAYGNLSAVRISLSVRYARPRRITPEALERFRLALQTMDGRRYPNPATVPLVLPPAVENQKMRLLTIKEVAECLVVSDDHVRNLIESRRLTAINVGVGVRRVWRVSEEALEAFIMAYSTCPPAPRSPRGRARPTTYTEFF